MKLLLTSSGIKNATIHDALIDLLGKPLSACDALFVPTGIYPFSGGGHMAWRALSGKVSSPLCELGWKSLGLLELTALNSVDRKAWVPAVEATDALLVWGGDPLYLSYWMRESGLAALLRSPSRDLVYVGVSAGSMVTASTFGEAYREQPNAAAADHRAEAIEFDSPQGTLRRTFVTAKGLGLVDFAVIPHLDHEEHPDASLANAERWAEKLPVPTYALDDESALKVADGNVDVVSEGHWKRFTP